MVMGLYRNKVYVGLQNTVISENYTQQIFEKNNHIGEWYRNYYRKGNILLEYYLLFI